MLAPPEAAPWEAPSIQHLDVAEIAPLLALHPLQEFLLLGTGDTLIQPHRAFVRALEGRGIGVESMDSRAAARAWGVLRAADRWLVGAFLTLYIGSERCRERECQDV